MTILNNVLSRSHKNSFPNQRAGALSKSRALHLPVSKTSAQELQSNIPTNHFKQPEFKRIVPDGQKEKQFSNSNNPTIVYDSNLNNVLENLTFKKPQKNSKNMGVKLVL